MEKKEVKKINRLPKEEVKKILKKLFVNLSFLIVTVIYYLVLIMGFINIDTGMLTIDLQFFVISLFLLGIILIEFSYNKDDGIFSLYGIEILTNTIITGFLTRYHLLNPENYIRALTNIIVFISIYYTLKIVLIYITDKKDYHINEMKKTIENN